MLLFWHFHPLPLGTETAIGAIPVSRCWLAGPANTQLPCPRPRTKYIQRRTNLDTCHLTTPSRENFACFLSLGTTAPPSSCQLTTHSGDSGARIPGSIYLFARRKRTGAFASSLPSVATTQTANTAPHVNLSLPQQCCGWPGYGVSGAADHRQGCRELDILLVLLTPGGVSRPWAHHWTALPSME
ncbi:hypothetical protein BT67DRAFT_30112 [Trichocladium antarcticum]|uniref:Uncharacterized protein n=1 Tax=Trichocladium antarcticum TaxID=1450529 RepID=A0AAN6UTK5_9PEZI|nr:hypothetical protein BT67DRAFT_30112 [Trichocladium antarcticum]